MELHIHLKLGEKIFSFQALFLWKKRLHTYKTLPFISTPFRYIIERCIAIPIGMQWFRKCESMLVLGGHHFEWRTASF
jgi:hypothetical protein